MRPRDSATRKATVRFRPKLLALVRAYADETGLTLNEAMQQLILKGLIQYGKFSKPSISVENEFTILGGQWYGQDRRPG